MKPDKLLLALLPLLLPATASTADNGRIKRGPPTELETERLASDMAMNDSLLQKGDIVVTDKGFFVFRGWAADGADGDFVPIPNPLTSKQ